MILYSASICYLYRVNILDKQEVSNNNNIAPKPVEVPERPQKRKSLIANVRKLEDVKSYNNAVPLDKNQPAGSNYEYLYPYIVLLCQKQV
jgi:hypothetical protein